MTTTSNYKCIFSMGHDYGNSWACKSLYVLQQRGVPDLHSLGSPLMPLTLYKTHVRGVLQRQRSVGNAEATASHSIPLPYAAMQQSCILRMMPKSWKAMSWAELRGHRSMCRLRAGILSLGHLRGKRTSLPQSQCILCDKLVRSPYAHALGECRAFDASGLPLEWAMLTAKDAAFCLLTSVPGQAHFHAAARIAREIEDAHDAFWH